MALSFDRKIGRQQIRLLPPMNAMAEG